MPIFNRAESFCARFRLKMPILLAPMAGASAPTLSAAVMAGGGLGACGALLMQPKEILQWAEKVRSLSRGSFQLNLWIPDPVPVRDRNREENLREFLANWGPEVPASAGDQTPPSFEAQCEALIEASPVAISSVMGLFPSDYVERARSKGIAWFAITSTLAEAKEAEAAGADVIVVQGMEAGGHRASFKAEHAERDQVGLFSLLPAVVDAVSVPVVATGGIADGRGVVAALALGASAAQIGTGFLRCPEAQIHPAWADAIGRTPPEGTRLSRVFSGRTGRSVATTYVEAATAPDAPTPASYPVQRGLTALMRAEAVKQGDVERMQAWAGQSASLAQPEPAQDFAQRIWADTRAMVR
ncbi:nitronate monooxygenase [Rhizobiales bacterium GAS191]|nr:nitronate monooxygenase [Rhizobiales bacterium GAS113]SED85179.1 nitronate monooxygenase [Rhizobiales bacterium GAS188]SEE64117.1 nitronate monooxygenase [Rhizobiales bacterium GAS191]